MTLEGWRAHIVRIKPSTDMGRDAIAKFGNVFWRRPSSNGNAHLIPVVDGIPRVADFIHVPSSDILKPEEDVGFGQGDAPNGYTVK